jgi:hypothetical protein
VNANFVDLISRGTHPLVLAGTILMVGVLVTRVLPFAILQSGNSSASLHLSQASRCRMPAARRRYLPPRLGNPWRERPPGIHANPSHGYCGSSERPGLTSGLERLEIGIVEVCPVINGKIRRPIAKALQRLAHHAQAAHPLPANPCCAQQQRIVGDGQVVVVADQAKGLPAPDGLGAAVHEVGRAPPFKGPAKAVFFTTGAEAVENAVKSYRATSATCRRSRRVPAGSGREAMPRQAVSRLGCQPTSPASSSIAIKRNFAPTGRDHLGRYEPLPHCCRAWWCAVSADCALWRPTTMTAMRRATFVVARTLVTVGLFANR